MVYTDFILQAGYVLGYIVIFLIIFVESGLFFGFFLPGDSFLFALGLIASQGLLSLPLILILGCIAAILGDSVGYAFGRKVGPSLFNRPNSRFLNQENLQKAREFYNEHGKKAIILARFTPFIRTFAPIVAGVAGMHYPTFLLYNIIGGISWVVSITTIAYYLGNKIPHIEEYVSYIVAAIVILSIIPIISHLRKPPRGK